MKHRKKAIAGAVGAPVLAVLLTWGLQCWTAYQTAATNHQEWERAVTVCESRGGMWWRGTCKRIPAEDWREPK